MKKKCKENTIKKIEESFHEIKEKRDVRGVVGALLLMPDSVLYRHKNCVLVYYFFHCS